MRKRRKKLPLYENAEITGIGAEGKAIARINDLVVFVTNCVPGDIVDLQVKKKRKNYQEGCPVKYHKYSDIRTEAICELFGICGGCKWQILPYSEQLKYKQQQVEDNFIRIGGIPDPPVLPIIPSAKTTFYRNKMEYTFSANRWLTEDDMSDEIKDTNALGLHAPGKYDKVVDIKLCHLQEEPSNKIRNTIKEYAKQNNLQFYNERKHEGFLRNLIIRITTTGEIMVIVIFGHYEKDKVEMLMDHISELFPEINSLLYFINEKHNDSIHDLKPVNYKGKDHITEQMGELIFRISPRSFFQTNSDQVHTLYKIVREYADLKGDETVYDIFTGTGTIANFLAPHAKKVVGLEIVREAVTDAVINSEINGIKNTVFHCGDVKDMLNDNFFSTNGYPSLIILDPPRSGIHKDAVTKILNAGSGKIIYISCNPATQARDLQILSSGYSPVKIQPVDMFPHTHHIENVTLLIKK